MRRRRSVPRHGVGAHRRPASGGRARAGNKDKSRKTKRSRTPLRQRLRLRPSVVAALGFAAVVLVTSMPVSALLTQRTQLSSTAAALTRARAADQSLGAEAAALRNPSTVAGLARTEYGLVPSGQKAYVILPPAGSSSVTVTGSGHVPLDAGPVVPGSVQSRQLLGLAPPSTSSAPRVPTSAEGAPRTVRFDGNRQGTAVAAGFWGRVVHTLEFWQ